MLVLSKPHPITPPTKKSKLITGQVQKSGVSDIVGPSTYHAASLMSHLKVQQAIQSSSRLPLTLQHCIESCPFSQLLWYYRLPSANHIQMILLTHVHKMFLSGQLLLILHRWSVCMLCHWVVLTGAWLFVCISLSHRLKSEYIIHINIVFSTSVATLLHNQVDIQYVS